MDVTGRIKRLFSLTTKFIIKRRSPRRGHVLVHVGEEEEGKRYEVPLKYLSSPDMAALIRRHGEEHLEEKIDGPLRAYCCTHVFNELLSRLGQVRDKDHS